MTLLMKRSVVFFELDRVIRRIRPDRARHYVDQYGELPPAPIKVGDQELVEKVARWIRNYCEEHDCIAIGVDQAPYLEDGFDLDDYHAIIRELMVMLTDYGIPVKDILWCEHKLHEETVYDERGNSAVKKSVVCPCRFPNPGLLKAAAEKHHVTVFNDRGEFRFFKPSIFVLDSTEARTAAIEQCGLNVQWVEAILTNRVGLKDQAEHAHLKAAALIREHQKRGLKVIGHHPGVDGWTEASEIVTIDTETLPEMPALPAHLDKPLV